jgi:hypothetical protein
LTKAACDFILFFLFILMLQGCAPEMFMLLLKLQLELANILYMLLIKIMFLLLIKSQPELTMGILFLLLIKMHHLLSVATSWVTGFGVFG